MDSNCCGSFWGFTLLVCIATDKKQTRPQKVDTVSTLEKVIKTSSLSTYETVYNGVAVVMNEEKPEQVDYCVSYNATVKAGLDFKDIKISMDEENHIISVQLPEIELSDPVIPIQKSEYIIVNKKINQDAISAKAYSICIEDAKEEAKKRDAIFKYARENAQKLIEGLISPFISQLEEEYRISFEWKGVK